MYWQSDELIEGLVDSCSGELMKWWSYRAINKWNVVLMECDGLIEWLIDGLKQWYFDGVMN